MEISILLKRLKDHNIRLSRKGENLEVGFDKDMVTADLFDEIRQNKDALLGYLRQKEKYREISTAAPSPSGYVLSSAQRRLWLLCQFEGGNAAYNISWAPLFKGELEPAGLQYAFKTLIQRHESLRTRFGENDEGEVRQYIVPGEEVDSGIVVYDLRGEKDPRGTVNALLTTESNTPFDLRSGPLIRIIVLRCGQDEWVLNCSMHHVCCDGQSIAIAMRELLFYYQRYVSREASLLPALPMQYKDYSSWQQEMLQEGILEAAAVYWQKKMSAPLPVTELAGDRKRPAIKTYNGAVISRLIDTRTAAGLKSLSQDQGGTLFMGLLTLVYILLYRYTGQEDLIIGSPVAGREHPDLENQIGLYTNTLALRTKIDGKEGFIPLFHRVKEMALEAFEYQAYPFDELVSRLGLKVDMSRNPLFDIVVVLQNTGVGDLKGMVSPDGLAISEYDASGVRRFMAKFDLSFNFAQVGNEFRFSLEYNRDIYSENVALRLTDHLRRLMDAVIREPDAGIGEVEYLSGEERSDLLKLLDEGEAGYPREATIVSLFEEQVRRRPLGVALSYGVRELSYGELNASADRLGRYLRLRYGVVREELVGIRLERGMEMIIAMLGVLKSGGAYVPLDGEHPGSRLEYILSDSGCRVVIDDFFWREWLEEGEKEMGEETDWERSRPGDLAYVIYTSGTTGQPKGTLIEHGNVVRLLRSEGFPFCFGEGDVWTMFHSYCFDFSVWEMYGALLNGGRLVVVSKEEVRDPGGFLGLLVREGVTVLNQTPSAFYQLQREAEQRGYPELALRYVIFGGEALKPGQLKGWRQRYGETKLVNMYGITETTVHVTYKEIGEEEIENNIGNIGRPIPTLSCYVLDRGGNPCPVGVAGELYVGGKGVSRGYWRREELTEQRFIVSPFRSGDRLYRSGDLVKLLESGELVYLGRLDDQVKIRGHRVELQEVERVLEGYGTIEEAVVTVRGMEDGEKELVAYVVSGSELNATELRGYLGGKLPGYMLPAQYVQLEKIPLTENGKVDKGRLPDAGAASLRGEEAYEAPRNQLEEQLAAIWKEVLGRDRIGIRDNFFEAGGNSIKIIRLSNLISRALSRAVSVAALFQYPCIKDLVNHLHEAPVPVVEEPDRGEVISDLLKFNLSHYES